jgi:transposase-like protein
MAKTVPPVNPKKKRVTMNLAYKQHILKESEVAGNLVRGTAIKYGIQPKQIRDWRKSFAESHDASMATATGCDYTVLKAHRLLQSSKLKRFKAGGRKPAFPGVLGKDP